MKTDKKRKVYHRYTYKEIERVKEAYLTHSDTQLAQEIGVEKLSITNLRARLSLIKPGETVKDWVRKYKQSNPPPRKPTSITAGRWDEIRAFFRHRIHPSLPSLQIKKIHLMIKEKKNKLKNGNDTKLSPLEGQ